MTAITWVVGDVHGCASELQELLDVLALSDADRVISVGDLYHRGPDPVGVWNVVRSLPRFEAIRGNHEAAMLRREDPTDLRGDGGAVMAAEDAASLADLRADAQHWPQSLVGEHGGQAWWVVHGGYIPGKPLTDHSESELVRLRALRGYEDEVLWFEVHEGPQLVLFGHKPFRRPFVKEVDGRPVCIGLDTGCVYGGRLTAYAIETGEFRSVAARRRF